MSALYAKVAIPTVRDPRGNLTIIESNQAAPFEVRRLYFIHGVPQGAERGGHAHRNLQQLLVAVTGSFRLRLSDGTSWETVICDDPTVGVLIGPWIWRELDMFSEGAVCLTAASRLYDEADYVRDFDSFAIHATHRHQGEFQ
jgi:hypothetical protein